ncbi:DUF692 family protein, partial [Escherichia coli]|nr:DUF692 family protein [Escherichia coli]
YAYIDRFPLELVGEIHLAGYDEAFDGAGDRLLIDAHGSAVLDDVLALYRHALARGGPRPTLVEWDNNIPDWATLYSEAAKADAMLATASSSHSVRRVA